MSQKDDKSHAADIFDSVDDSDYEQWERDCERIRKQNGEYLAIFEQDLVDKGLSIKTINRHLDNVSFYLNEYLLYYETRQMEEGCYGVGGFLGDFFIRKCMWSTPNTIKTNAASLKKFYKCMLDHGLIERESYDELLRSIKESMTEWQECCARFNDPDNYSNPFFDDLWLDDFSEEVDGFGEGTDVRGEPGSNGKYGNPELDGLTMDNVNEMLMELFKEELGKQVRQRAEEAAKQVVESPEEPPNREQAIDMLTLMLFYLTSWEERVGGKGGFVERRSWKSADWGALDRLREAGLISCTNKAKSVTISDAGARVAEISLISLGLEHLL